MPPTPDDAKLPIKSLVMAVYVPIVIHAIGEGAVMPFIVLGAQKLGASAAAAGGIFAIQGVASFVLAMPTGVLISRVGTRRAAVASVAATLAGLIGAILGTSLWVYAVSIFLIGSGWSMWRLVRFDFLVGAVPIEKRGRALSVMGGSQRIGKFVGPLLAAAAIVSFGLNGAFLLHVLVAVIALVVFVSVPLTDVDVEPPSKRPRLRDLAGEHRGPLSRAGGGIISLLILRSARPVILPLWAIHVGLDAAAVGLIFGLSAAVDAVLFYPAGIVMDRKGRKWVAIPSTLILATSFLILPLANSFTGLLGVGILMGLGNGIGSGYGAVIGSDLAPEEGRAEFLGIWRMVGNVGTISGPLVLSGIVAAASLGIASVVIGVIGVLGGAYITAFVPETLVKQE